ncbi:hypothetical protein Peetri_00053 [Pseudomonas phage vB_PpuM-Peetri]
MARHRGRVKPEPRRPASTKMSELLTLSYARPSSIALICRFREIFGMNYTEVKNDQRKR